jgi:hypothetical protein
MRLAAITTLLLPAIASVQAAALQQQSDDKQPAAIPVPPPCPFTLFNYRRIGSFGGFRNFIALAYASFAKFHKTLDVFLGVGWEKCLKLQVCLIFQRKKKPTL